MHTDLLLTIPTSERVWEVGYDEKDNLIYAITSNKARTTYYRYIRKDNQLVKTKKSKSPLDLREE